MPSSERTSDMLRAGQLGSASSLSVTQTSGAPEDSFSSLLSFWHRSWKSSAQTRDARFSCSFAAQSAMLPVSDE